MKETKLREIIREEIERINEGLAYAASEKFVQILVFKKPKNEKEFIKLAKKNINVATPLDEKSLKKVWKYWDGLSERERDTLHAYGDLESKLRNAYLGR